MLRKKAATVLYIILVVASGSLWADIRDQVCIVRPILDTDIKASFKKLAQDLQKENEKELADFFDSYAEGGYGSGFLLMDSQRKSWIVTNRHVVAMASQADVEFQKSDGTSLEFKGCPIVYMDDSTDLAFIAFPAGATPPPYSFILSSTTLEDGLEVWSAGYPGLLDRPAWQLGKGSITNNKVSVPELASTDATWFIQHSAPIDPGNSGGPLLVRSQTPSGYSYTVVGINSWSMAGRQSTFFAIPAVNVAALLEKANAASTLSAAAIDLLLEPSANDFASALNGSSGDSVSNFRFISYSGAASMGWGDLLVVERTLGEKESRVWHERMRGGLPIEILRQASWEKMAIGMSRSYSTPDVALEKIATPPADGPLGRTAQLQFKVGTKTFLSDWKWEGGHWRFSKADLAGVLKADALLANKERTATAGGSSAPPGSGGFLGLDAGAGAGSFFSEISLLMEGWSGGLELGSTASYDGFSTTFSQLLSVWSIGAIDTMTGSFVGSCYAAQYMIRFMVGFGSKDSSVHPVVFAGLGGSLGLPLVYTGDAQLGLGLEFGRATVKEIRFGLALTGDAYAWMLGDLTSQIIVFARVGFMSWIRFPTS
jgi:S1-C subfamily serine protease